ncbi:MAG TPA: hypothetical protein VMV46_04730 [Thermoanaerobaculia bacterium]|nr:hypothetical protein [Thermoanaerobaculia bacterium]
MSEHRTACRPLTSKGPARPRSRTGPCRRGAPRRGLGVLALGLLALCGIGSAALAADGAAISTADVHWWFDHETAIGSSILVRSESGVTAVVETSGLPSGHAMTLWVIFFNRPEACDSSPCADLEAAPDELLADLFAPSVEADFHFGSGVVTGAGARVVFGGHLAIDDLTGSGRAEIGFDEGVPLLDPARAEILLAIHSHGPKLRGRDLKAQISSYLGGCATFLGAAGFATGPDEVPDSANECATIQYSLHRADGE